MPFKGDVRVEGRAFVRVLDGITGGRYGAL
jgi:hypothetical protein